MASQVIPARLDRHQPDRRGRSTPQPRRTKALTREQITALFELKTDVRDQTLRRLR